MNEKIMRLPHIKTATGVEATLDDFIDAVLGKRTRFESESEYVTKHDNMGAMRAMYALGINTDDADEIKRTLPAWYLGGVCANPISQANALEGELSCIVCVDFDHVGVGTQGDEREERIAAVKRTLSRIPCVIMAAKSVTGRGVFALVRTTKAIQTNPDAVKRLFDVFDDMCLNPHNDSHDEYSMELPDGTFVIESVDKSCANVDRRRIESYDPDAYINRDATVYIDDDEFRAQATRAFQTSTLATLSKALKGTQNVKPTDTEVGVVMSCAAVATKGRVAQRIFSERFDPVPLRSQIVVVGRSGSGKSTAANRLKNIVGDIAMRIMPGSDTQLDVCVVESAFVEDKEQAGLTDEDKAKYRGYKPRQYPMPIYEIIDEASDDKKANKQQLWKIKTEQKHRLLFDRDYFVHVTKGTPLPSVNFRTAYTSIALSTPEAWAMATRNDDSTIGDARRIIEFYQESPEEKMPHRRPSALLFYEPENARPADETRVHDWMHGIAKWVDSQTLDDFYSPFPPDGQDGEKSYDEILRMQRQIVLESNISPLTKQRAGEWILSKYHEEDIEGARSQIVTIIGNVAGLCAALDKRTHVTEDDFLAAVMVTLGVMDTRARIKAAGINAHHAITKEEEINETILDRLRASRNGKMRKSQMLGFLKKRGSKYVNALDELVIYREVIEFSEKINGKSTRFYRLPTAEERDALQNTIDTDSSPQGVPQVAPTLVSANKPVFAFNGSETAFSPMERTEYADATKDGKERKLVAYLEAFQRDNPIVHGNRDNALRKLAVCLQKAGMWDDVAQAFFNEQCDAVGLGKDKKRLGRPMRS